MHNVADKCARQIAVNTWALSIAIQKLRQHRVKRATIKAIVKTVVDNGMGRHVDMSNFKEN